MQFRGVARILGKGVLDYARAKFLSHAHLSPGKVKVQLSGQREHVLNVASELVQGFQPNLGIR